MPIKKTKTPAISTGFDFGSSSLGRILLAMQGPSIVRISLGDNENELLADAQIHFPAIRQNSTDPAISGALEQLQCLLDQPATAWTPPLDLQGTDFQKQVWAGISKIPAGATVTYQQLASSIGRKSSVRAVASACGANPVAIVVPCHRVLRSDGGLGGYRWGVQRKKELLLREAELFGEDATAGGVSMVTRMRYAMG